MFLLVALCHAETGAAAASTLAAPTEDPWAVPEGGLAPIDLESAEALPLLDGAGLRYLAPRHWRLPANARGQTDFTAYTLEWGEVRLGVAGLTVGVLPRTQLGTVPALDALGVLNGQLKVDLVRVGPLDIGTSARVYRFGGETMDAAYLSAGVTASALIAPVWSVHAGGEWSSFAAAGTPNLDPLIPWFDRFVGFTPSDTMVSQVEGDLAIDATGKTLSVKVATDVRFNRRDSLILQGQAMVWGKTDLPASIPPAFTGGAPLGEADGRVAITDAYATSLAYQLAMKHLELRVGVGISSVPGAWLLQSTELAYRFGGPTRTTERRMVRGWRQNKRGVHQEARTSGEQPDPS